MEEVFSSGAKNRKTEGKMAVFKLENDAVSAEVDDNPAQIRSFKDKDTGLEYMWQGDETHWKWQNPTLFPMVGHTWDKKIRLKGQVYEMPNHGFARNFPWTTLSHDEKKVVMELRENAETLKMYPYAFSLQICYELKDRELHISYTLKNRSGETMPFNFGLHPGFNCPLQPGRDWTSCKLYYADPETFDSSDLHVRSERIVELDRARLEATIIEHHPVSPWVQLTDGEHAVRVSLSGFEWVAFWSPADAPFVCIEPWHSIGDDRENDLPFEKRPGTMLLEKDGTWNTAYTITIL